jgi:hypothetical protein
MIFWHPQGKVYEGKGIMKKAIIVTAAIGAIALFAMLPDVKRYIRITTM